MLEEELDQGAFIFGGVAPDFAGFCVGVEFLDGVRREVGASDGVAECGREGDGFACFGGEGIEGEVEGAEVLEVWRVCEGEDAVFVEPIEGEVEGGELCKRGGVCEGDGTVVSAFGSG